MENIVPSLLRHVSRLNALLSFMLAGGRFSMRAAKRQVENFEQRVRDWLVEQVLAAAEAGRVIGAYGTPRPREPREFLKDHTPLTTRGRRFFALIRLGNRLEAAERVIANPARALRRAARALGINYLSYIAAERQTHAPPTDDPQTLMPAQDPLLPRPDT